MPCYCHVPGAKPTGTRNRRAAGRSNSEAPLACQAEPIGLHGAAGPLQHGRVRSAPFAAPGVKRTGIVAQPLTAEITG